MKEIFWAFKTLLLFQTHKEVGEGKLRIPFIIAGILMSVTLWTGIVTIGFICFHKIPDWFLENDAGPIYKASVKPPMELSEGAILAMILVYVLALCIAAYIIEYVLRNVPTKKQ